MRISVENLKLPDSQGRKPETSGLERAEIYGPDHSETADCREALARL